MDLDQEIPRRAKLAAYELGCQDLEMLLRRRLAVALEGLRAARGRYPMDFDVAMAEIECLDTEIALLRYAETAGDAAEVDPDEPPGERLRKAAARSARRRMQRAPGEKE